MRVLEGGREERGQKGRDVSAFRWFEHSWISGEEGGTSLEEVLLLSEVRDQERKTLLAHRAEEP